MVDKPETKRKEPDAKLVALDVILTLSPRLSEKIEKFRPKLKRKSLRSNTDIRKSPMGPAAPKLLTFSSLCEKNEKGRLKTSRAPPVSL